MKLRKILTLPCEEAVELVSQGLDHRLSFGQRSALRLHLVVCKACRTYRKQITLIRCVLSTFYDTDEPSEGAAIPRLSSEARRRIAGALDTSE